MDVQVPVLVLVPVQQMLYTTAQIVIQFVHLLVKTDVKNRVLEIVKQNVHLHVKTDVIQDVKPHAIPLVRSIVKEDVKAIVKEGALEHAKQVAKVVAVDNVEEHVELLAGDLCSLILG